MTFLPIVDRELRVAARRKSTYRIRAWAAAVALLVGCFSLLPALLIQAFASPGKPIYTTLTSFAFGLCLLAGVLLTADCLSEEKRERTLGLLFLTDLKGYDVVLGKFMAMSLNAFYGLLAILPITGLPLLLGGVTGGEFWRMNLALLNALFLSLAAGVCVSAFGRDSQRAMGGTLGLVIFLAGGLPALAAVGTALGVPPAGERLAWISPYYPFARALEPKYLSQPSSYWWALLTSQLFGWFLLGLASRALPRHWQDRAAAAEPGRGWLRVAQPRRRKLTGPAREELLSVNPALWLVSRGPDSRRTAWVIVGAWAVSVVTVSLLTRGRDNAVMVDPFMLGFYGVRPFGFLLKWLFALQACRFFVEARRTGALETLLCTPLTSRDILAGQALALKRTFFWPVVSFLALLFVPAGIQVFNAPAWNAPEMVTAFVQFLAGCLYCLLMVADCYAVGAFGMWLALTLKKPGLAPALTILYVLILPSFLCVLGVFADVFFIAWGVSKLHQQNLRILIARQYQPVTTGTPAAPAPATPGLPPVVGR